MRSIWTRVCSYDSYVRGHDIAKVIAIKVFVILLCEK